MNAPTQYQIGLLQHTLGISERHRDPHRNHFVAGPGHDDMADLEQLEAAGLMIRGHRPGFLPGDSIVFYTTEAGRYLALTSLPEPKKPSRYEEYLRADGCAGDSFGEFLCGGRLPKFEYHDCARYYGYGWYLAQQRSDLKDWRGYVYRMYRADAYGRHEIEGEWCKTKKEAKASYKAALKKHQENQQAERRAYA
ncbi:hypothetical protein [Cupriavidus sp. 2SB]|uniref:hypothetical protein n=1 Tax=Cupriavidus sp. 2SB TaxID=2502199 RepID=UPI0010F9F02D|nr:hypothetical protein [Cupriavidus sp. 2SB]